MAYQTLGASVDVRIAETSVAHGWGVDQGCNFSKVLCAEFVENVDIGVLELREELDGVARSALQTPG